MTRMPQIQAQGVDGDLHLDGLRHEGVLGYDDNRDTTGQDAQQPVDTSGVLPGPAAFGRGFTAASGALTPSAGASDTQARNPNPAERNTEAESGNTARAGRYAGGARIRGSGVAAASPPGSILTADSEEAAVSCEVRWR
jgi:hypothetical protein